MEKLEIGIDAFDFVKKIPDDIWPLVDTVVWDPPYSDEGGYYDLDYIDTKKGKKGRNMAEKMSRNKSKLVMPRKKRLEIYDYISAKGNYNYIHFFGNLKGKQELDFECQRECIWFKSNISHTNHFNFTNHEFFYLKTPNLKIGESGLNGKHVKYIWNIPTDSGYNKKTKTFLWTQRMAQKPLKLFNDLYKLLDSKFVLDPFAGYGNSIYAARKLGLSVYACDIDKTLKWRPNNKEDKKFEM
jgi:DNA modification methylase